MRVPEFIVEDLEYVTEIGDTERGRRRLSGLAEISNEKMIRAYKAAVNQKNIVTQDYPKDKGLYMGSPDRPGVKKRFDDTVRLIRKFRRQQNKFGSSIKKRYGLEGPLPHNFLAYPHDQKTIDTELKRIAAKRRLKRESYLDDIAEVVDSLNDNELAYLIQEISP